jgi:D-alanyl-D-alanine dipeptidase
MMRSFPAVCALAALAAAAAPGQSADEELVRVKELIPGIVLDLRYATADNFLHEKVYTADECLLAHGAVRSLIVVQDSLRSRGLGLKIFDGYRPRAVQYLMFAIFPNPAYVADPTSGSTHNRGGAVDVSLVRLSDGQELLMPTPFDFFGPEAGHSWTIGLNQEQIDNRALLRDMMTRVGGFTIYDDEWWHYTWPAAGGYPLLDFQMK